MAATDAATARARVTKATERTPASGPGYLTTRLLYLDGHCRANRRRNSTRTIIYNIKKRITNISYCNIKYYIIVINCTRAANWIQHQTCLTWEEVSLHIFHIILFFIDYCFSFRWCLLFSIVYKRELSIYLFVRKIVEFVWNSVPIPTSENVTFFIWHISFYLLVDGDKISINNTIL